MRKLLIAALLLCACQLMFAQESQFKGFYISRTGDTVYGSYRIPTLNNGMPDYSYLQSKAMFVDKDNMPQMIKPRDVNKLVFEANGETITMLTCKNTINIDNQLGNSHYIFLKLIIDGYVKLYEYYIKENTNSHCNPGAGVYFDERSAADKYCIQLGNSDLIKVKGISFKKDFTNLFADYQVLSDKINNKTYTKEDIQTIVNEYNLWYQGLSAW